jgi:hypothetical protein
MNTEPAPFPGTETVESSRRNDRDHDALAQSIRNLETDQSTDRDKTNKTTEAAGKIADVAKDAARATYNAVSAQASELVSSVASELETSAEDQKRRGAETMRTFAGAVQHAAAELDQQSPAVARQFRNAAQKVEDLSESLRDRSIRRLVDDASDLARRQPLWFFGGAIVAGFALSRFLKSSAGASTQNVGRTGQEPIPTSNLPPSE